MKFFSFFFCIVLFNLSISGQDALNWKAGEYSSYHTQWQNGEWEGFLLNVNKMVDGKSWELDVFHRTNIRDTIVRFHVPIKKEKGSLPAEIVGIKVIRGEEFQELDSNFIIVKIMNMLSLRFVDLEKVKSKKIQNSYCCNINSGREYEDRWDEFNYSLFHSMNHSTPILGLLSTRKSSADFTTNLTSFGRSTTDLATYKHYPTYIDVFSLQEITFPTFKVKYPTSWVFSQSKNSSENIEVWSTQLGGNIHAGYFLIKIIEDTREKIDLRLEEINRTKIFPNHALGELMRFESEEVDEKGNLFYKFQFKAPGQIGLQMEGYFLNENKTKLAEVILFTNFGAPIPDKTYVPNLINSFDKVLKSFKFRE